MARLAVRSRQQKRTRPRQESSVAYSLRRLTQRRESMRCARCRRGRGFTAAYKRIRPGPVLRCSMPRRAHGWCHRGVKSWWMFTDKTCKERPTSKCLVWATETNGTSWNGGNLTRGWQPAITETSNQECFGEFRRLHRARVGTLEHTRPHLLVGRAKHARPVLKAFGEATCPPSLTGI